MASQEKEDGTTRAAQDFAALEGGGSIAVGRHSLTLHGDVLRMDYHGSLDLDETVRLHAILEHMVRQRRHTFFLIVICEEVPATDEARKFMIGWHRTHRISGVAVVGTRSAVIRAVGTLLLRAVNLLRPEPLLMAFLKTEEEAHAYFARHRSESIPPRAPDGRHRSEPISVRSMR